MILGKESERQCGESCERSKNISAAILKQGELESGNNSRIFKAMSAFDESG